LRAPGSINHAEAPPARDPGEAVAPQLLDPPQTETTFPIKVMAHAVAPEAIADVIAFLVSDAAVHFAGRSCRLMALREPTWRVNHCDLVTTSHLAGGDPGSVAKPRTDTRARAPRLQGDTVTSPASGAGSAADLPDYKPTPRSALGPALNEQGY
jgi:hypothetical protein